MPGTSPSMTKCSAGLLDAENQSAATLLDFLAARSRSMTARQPVLRSARCLYMQAVIFGMFGISSLHRRKASPVHIRSPSALKAKPAVRDSARREAAKARAILALGEVLGGAAGHGG